MFKVNNTDTRTTPPSSVYMVNFKRVNPGWEGSFNHSLIFSQFEKVNCLSTSGRTKNAFTHKLLNSKIIGRVYNCLVILNFKGYKVLIYLGFNLLKKGVLKNLANFTGKHLC